MAYTMDIAYLRAHLTLTDVGFVKVLSGVSRRVKSTMQTMTRYTKYAMGIVTAQLTLATKAFASFEQQMAMVSTMLDEHSMKYMPQYASALQSMAVEFGESTQTLSKGLYDILSASIPPAKALDVLRVSTIAAKAGLTETAVAADAITTILNAYGMAVEEASKVSDIMFATVKRGKLTFPELAYNIGKVASTAATAGLSFEEISAALATMTRAGLQADLATTSLRAILNAFLSPAEDAKKAANALGLALNAATLENMGLTGVMRQLSGATADQIAAIVPSARAISGFTAQLRQASVMAEDLELMLNSLGMTQEAYNKMTNTLSFTLSRVWQTIKMVSVAMGERLAPEVKKIGEAFVENYELMKRWAQAFADEIIFLKNVLVEFVNFLRTDWERGFDVAVDIALAAFIAISEMAIEMALTTGRGIWQALKKGISDALDKDTYNLAREIYKKLGGEFMGEQIRGPLITVTPTLSSIALDPKLWEQARKQAETQLRGVATKELFSGMTDRMGQILEDFRLRMTKTTGEFGPILERQLTIREANRSMREFLNQWEDLKKLAEPFVDTLKEATENLKLMFGTAKETGEAVKEMFKFPENMRVELEKWYNDATDIFGNIGKVMTQAFDRGAQALADMVMEGKANFRDLVKSISRDILTMVIRWRMAGLLITAFPGIVPKEIKGTGFEKLQHGGIVRTPTLALIGEAGPEKVEPLSAMSERPPTVIINNNTGQPMEQEGEPMLVAGEWVVNVVVDRINRGGVLRDTISALRR